MKTIKGKSKLSWLGICLALASVVAIPTCSGKDNQSLVGLVEAAEYSNKASHKSPPLKVSFVPYPAMIQPIRIGIATRLPVTYIAVWDKGAVFIDNRPVFLLNPGLAYQISNAAITELSSGRKYQLPLNKRAQVCASNYIIWAANRWYRGALELVTFAHSTTIINVLDLEEYLRGVVPSEMPASWHLEALKAQSVAARSYAWAHINRGSKWSRCEGYDLVPDTRDQVYKGLAAEAKSTNLAIAATTGIVLKDANRVKSGFYRAWVGDAFENLNIRQSSIPSSTLEKLTGVPKILGVTVKRWENGNATSIEAMGPKKSREVDGIVLAHMLNFSTAGILDVKQAGPNWIFTYRGPGNGARGLSQHGANMLAENGWNWEQILRQYYQDPDGKLRIEYLDSYKSLFETMAAYRSIYQGK